MKLLELDLAAPGPRTDRVIANYIPNKILHVDDSKDLDNIRRASICAIGSAR